MIETRWFDLLREFFGVTLSEDRAIRWLKLLKEPDAIGDVGEKELEQVLRWVRKQREGEENRKTPNLEMLIGWIKWYRKEQAGQRRGYRSNTDQGIMGAVKSAMLNAKSHFLRWDIMCDPVGLGVRVERRTTIEECEVLDRWAGTQWPDWEDAKVKIRQNLARLTREWIAAFESHHEPNTERPAQPAAAVPEGGQDVALF